MCEPPPEPETDKEHITNATGTDGVPGAYGEFHSRNDYVPTPFGHKLIASNISKAAPVSDTAELPAELPGPRHGPSFRKELEALINRHSLENGSDTPDFILAQFVCGSITLFDEMTIARETWYGRHHGGAPIPEGVQPTSPALD